MSERKIDYSLALLCAIGALSPVLLYQQHFEALFWFGDELDLLLQLKREGLSHWAFKTFGENFVPVFKLLWIGIAELFNGSYLAVITALWITHAINTFLLWFLLKNCGATRFSSTLSAVTFGMSVSVLESLAWSVQWSAVLASMFTLVAFSIYPKDRSLRNIPSFILSLFFAVFSFSRGILACVVGSLFPLFWRSTKRWWMLSALFLFPAVLTAILISGGASGNHHQILNGDLASLKSMAEFGVHSFTLNPFYHLFRLSEITWATVVLLGGVKIGILAFGLWVAKTRSENLFKICFALMLFDLLNACLLGIGRHHTGIQFSVSSRYQYEYLITLSPFIGITVDSILSLAKRANLKNLLNFVFLSLWIFWIASPWKEEIKEWSKSRGKEGRKLLLKEHVTDPSADGTKLWWGVPPTISLQDAYEVVKEYNLH